MNSIEERFASIGFRCAEITLEHRCVGEVPVFHVTGYFAGGAKHNSLVPHRILKSGNRTIVFWADGTKTIVKRAEDEEDNDYAAFTAALGIKCFGSNSALKRIVERTEVQKPKKQEQGVDIPVSFAEVGKAAADAMRRLKDAICPDAEIAVCPDCGRAFKVQKGE